MLHNTLQNYHHKKGIGGQVVESCKRSKRGFLKESLWNKFMGGNMRQDWSEEELIDSRVLMHKKKENSF